MVIEADQANVAHGGDGGDLTAGAAQLEVGGQDRGRPGSAREQQLHPRHNHIKVWQIDNNDPRPRWALFNKGRDSPTYVWDLDTSRQLSHPI